MNERMTDETTRLFVAYRTTGDAEALATVFDQTAPKLLLFAMHWTSDAASAEDLVQTCFLDAMQVAHRFDADRPVLPWLVGILANRARGERRRLTRRVTVPIDPERDVLPGVERDPSNLVADADAMALVTAAIDDVPDAYRDVLVLNLVHGLRAIDIAHSLGRSPDTVRSQLRRGSRFLREKLPQSLAAPLAAMLIHGEGLARVRSAVLRAAQPAAALHSTWLTVMGWMAAAAVVVAAVTGWWWFHDPDQAAAHSSRATNPVQDELAAPADRLSQVQPTPPAAKRSVVAISSVQTNGPAIAGRCVDGTGRGIENCSIAVYESDAPYLARGRKHAIWTGRSDATGRFRVSLSRVPSPQATVIFRGSDWATLVTERLSVHAVDTTDLGTITMRPGVEVRGRITDALGRPVPDYHIYLERAGHPGRAPAPLAKVGAGTFSQEDGTFVLPERLAKGRYTMSRMANFLRRPMRPVELEVTPAKGGVTTLDISIPDLADEDQIRGIVIDEAGKPFPNFSLWVAVGDKKISSVETTSRGTFSLVRTAQYPDGELELSPGYGTERRAIALETTRTQWGARNVRVKLRRKAPLAPQPFRLRVLRADTKEPVKRYRVRFFAMGNQTYAGHGSKYIHRAMHSNGPHVDGRLRLERVLPVPHLIAVYPEDPELVLSELREFTPGTREHTIELQPRQALQVKVVSGQQQPILGATVELIRAPKPEQFALHTPAFPAAKCWAPGPQILATAKTDANGIAKLWGAKRTAPYVLRVHGPNRVARIFRDVTMQKGLRTLSLDSGATLHGTVGPLTRLAALIRTKPDAPVLLQVVEVGGTRVHPTGPNKPAKIGTDGSFRLTDIPAGTWRVRVSYYDPSMMQYQHIDRPGQHVLTPGSSQRIQVKLPAREPGTLRGRALLDGKPLARGQVRLVPLGPGIAMTRKVPTDADGYFKASLPPARYRVDTVTPEMHMAPLQSATTATIAPGGEATQTFQLWTEAARITMQDANGKPLASATCSIGSRHVVNGRDLGMVYRVDRLRTDGFGHLRVDRLPKKFYVKVQTGAGAHQVHGPFDRATGVIEFDLKIRLRK